MFLLCLKNRERGKETMAKKDEAKETQTKEKTKTKDTKVAADLSTTEDITVETYSRRTPFGVETWDPKTKSTTMSSDG